jgi:hypothetical protein
VIDELQMNQSRHLYQKYENILAAPGSIICVDNRSGETKRKTIIEEKF